MNDFQYKFEPLTIFTPDPDYKVDEAELRKSIEKSKRLMDVVEAYNEKMDKKEKCLSEQLIRVLSERNR